MGIQSSSVGPGCMSPDTSLLLFLFFPVVIIFSLVYTSDMKTDSVLTGMSVLS